MKSRMRLIISNQATNHKRKIMRVKVSDYIAGYLANREINQIFTVVGGGAMHLNNSFGHHPKLHCTYNHHEQASAIAAEGYTRLHNRMAVVCVTSGPGAINALNGVAGAYMDSIPMLVISGQTKSTLTVRNSGLHLRTLGNQEFDIISAVGGMTKYCEMILDANKIKYYLDKACILATSGRPGPCWLDIPLDIQGAFIETDELIGYKAEELPKQNKMKEATEKTELLYKVLEHLKSAKRPVIYAGNGIRLADGVGKLHELVNQLGIPVVTCWNSIDLMETEDIYYAGRGGTMGDRAGNFAVQNSDLLLSIGSRLNIYQVGYNVDTWAREAYTVVVDIDLEELKKPTIRVDLPVCLDAKEFIVDILQATVGWRNQQYEEWVQQCNLWKNKYPVYQKKDFSHTDCTDMYAFIHTLSAKLPVNAVTVVANGSASVIGSQTYVIGQGQRFLMNCGLSSMGYDLPAAIGACIANNKERVYCIAGDGSIQMNLQELQTIITNQLPIGIYVINNQGYHQIRLTQNNIFHDGLIGVGPESKDLGFPDIKKLADAYGYPYYCCHNDYEIEQIVDTTIATSGSFICEIFADTEQIFAPKLTTKRLPDGSLFSLPLEDMAPLLSREEMKENMIIDMIE